MWLDSFIGPINARNQLPKYLSLHLPMTASMRYSVIWNLLITHSRILGLGFSKKTCVFSAQGQLATSLGPTPNQGKLPYILYNN